MPHIGGFWKFFPYARHCDSLIQPGKQKTNITNLNRHEGCQLGSWYYLCLCLAPKLTCRSCTPSEGTCVPAQIQAKGLLLINMKILLLYYLVTLLCLSYFHHHLHLHHLHCQTMVQWQKKHSCQVQLLQKQPFNKATVWNVNSRIWMPLSVGISVRLLLTLSCFCAVIAYAGSLLCSSYFSNDAQHKQKHNLNLPQTYSENRVRLFSDNVKSTIV